MGFLIAKNHNICEACSLYKDVYIFKMCKFGVNRFYVYVFESLSCSLKAAFILMKHTVKTVIL